MLANISCPGTSTGQCIPFLIFFTAPNSVHLGGADSNPRFLKSANRNSPHPFYETDIPGIIKL
jgi:hypothetical protein